VSLSVCPLLVGYLEKLLTDLNQIMSNDRPSAMDQSINFGIDSDLDLDPR